MKTGGELMERLYLVCYDIVADSRRNRVAKLLLRYGLRVQKSVFECVLTPKQQEQLLRGLDRIIAPREDQVRFYAISGRSREMALILGVQPDWSIDDDVFIV